MTNAELAILSLIAEQPRYGYEIEAIIEERGMREWTEVGFSSIYYLLKKLQKDGLAEARTEPPAGRGPGRQVYRITAAGRAALRTGVRDALSTPARRYPPLQLGLANLPILEPGEALLALREYRDALVERRDHVQARREAQCPLPYFVDAMFEHSLALIGAEVEWTAQFISQLEDQAGSTTRTVEPEEMP